MTILTIGEGQINKKIKPWKIFHGFFILFFCYTGENIPNKIIPTMVIAIAK